MVDGRGYGYVLFILLDWGLLMVMVCIWEVLCDGLGYLDGKMGWLGWGC